MISLVLSGGVGSRLWPLSREKLPKQFSPLFEKSLFQLTVERLAQLGEVQVCTGEGLRVLTEQSLRQQELPVSKVYFEPVGRNTAPAIALACKVLGMEGRGHEVLGVFPSDHWIEDTAEFVKVIRSCEQWALKNKIVTLGIKPHYAATGFGYIECAEPADSIAAHQAFLVKGFREKPDQKTAEAFLKAKNFFWNSGMFVFKVDKMIAAFEEHMPELWRGLEGLKQDLSNLDQIFPRLPSQSIDYGVMEKEKAQVNIPSDFGWSDLGSWDDVAEIAKRHPLSQPSQTLQQHSNNCFGFSATGRLIAFSEVDDLIVVDSEDALLITAKGKSQSVKALVSLLEKERPELSKEATVEHRPWGDFRRIWETSDFKTKVITVLPKQQLSYQSHQKREEIWIVVQGTGQVVLDEQVIDVKKGSHLRVPKQSKHRMRNTGVESLVFVEVQLGEYFGEDDITRYQDDYQRV